MKKISCLILAMLLLLTIICGCNDNKNDKNKVQSGAQSTASNVETTSSDDVVSYEENNSSEDLTSSEDTPNNYTPQYPQTTPVDTPNDYGNTNTDGGDTDVKKQWYYNEYGEELRSGLRAGVSLSYVGEWGQKELVKDPDAAIYSRDYYSTIAVAGFDHVRIPFGLADATVGKAPDWDLDIELCRYWDNAINTALEVGLIVIFDNHENNPQNHDRTVKIWEQIAKRYRYYPEELMFSFLTSPNRYVTSDAELNDLQKRCVAAVRKSSPNRTCILQLNNWNKYSTLWYTQVPFLYDEKGKVVTNKDGSPVYDPNIMIAPHHYEPEYWTNQGANGYAANQHWGPSIQQEITKVFEQFAEYEKSTGRQIWIAECGVSTKNHDAACASYCFGNYYKHFSSEAARLDISYCVWNFNNGSFAIFDNNTKEFFPYVLENLVLEW